MLYNCGRIFFILSFFVGYILSFGLVRCTHWVQVFSLARGGHDNHGCHNKNPGSDRGCEWRHARMWWAGILGYFFKKAVSWDLRLDETNWDLNLDGASWFSELGRPGQASSGLRDTLLFVGSDATVGIVKIVSLSPRVKNLKVKKIIKVSDLNPESRQCFVFFGFLCVWIFYACEYFMYDVHFIYS